MFLTHAAASSEPLPETTLQNWAKISSSESPFFSIAALKAFASRFAMKFEMSSSDTAAVSCSATASEAFAVTTAGFAWACAGAPPSALNTALNVPIAAATSVSIDTASLSGIARNACTCCSAFTAPPRLDRSPRVSTDASVASVNRLKTATRSAGASAGPTTSSTSESKAATERSWTLRTNWPKRPRAAASAVPGTLAEPLRPRQATPSWVAFMEQRTQKSS
mmetsp:Transcript_5209/g.13511  ORF Transcript_5209/g.13511 Transcript_5209/m.13511 type:complete len:222 (-) Transcript_5209:534-1199(-)